MGVLPHGVGVLLPDVEVLPRWVGVLSRSVGFPPPWEGVLPLWVGFYSLGRVPHPWVEVMYPWVFGNLDCIPNVGSHAGVDYRRAYGLRECVAIYTLMNTMLFAG